MAENIELEQETASVMEFALRTAGDINPYYWDVPQDFKRPAMYFPQPEIDTGGDTLGTYASEYAWYINVFADTTEEAHGIARRVLTALKRAKNYVPLLNEDGEATGKKLRLKDPGLKRGDVGVAQLTIEWTSRRSYADDEPPKVNITHILFSKKEDSPDGE